jgi:tetratricopeptide (TPR) repeat protein
MTVKFLDPDGQLPAAGRSSLESCFALLMNGDYKETFELLTQLTKDEDSLVKGLAFLFLGDLYHFQWEFKLSADSYARAKEVLTSLGHQRGLILTEMRIADILVDEADSTGLPADRKASARAEGARRLNQAVADADQLGDGFVRGFGAHYLALFATEQQDWPEAIAQAQRAVEIRESIGDTVFAPSSMALLARAKGELGDYQDALDLAEQTYRLQMERNLRGAAMRTLAIIAYINEQWHLRRSNELTSQFTAVEPIARTPFLLGDHSEDELAVAAHAAGGETPVMGAVRGMDNARAALVSGADNLVFMLSS